MGMKVEVIGPDGTFSLSSAGEIKITDATGKVIFINCEGLRPTARYVECGRFVAVSATPKIDKMGWATGEMY